MNTRFLAIWILFLSFCGKAEGAERAWKVIAGYDYYFPNDSGSGLKDQLASLSDTVLASGYDSTTYNLDTQGGSGARVGVLYPFADRVLLGATLGYVVGPTMNANFTAASGALGNGGLTISRAAGFIRFLPDVRVNLANSGAWSFDLDSAWGAGFGSISQSCTASGSLTCPFDNTTQKWVGFTWELSPVISWKLKNATLTLAPRYAGFPYFSGTGQIPPMDWQTFGVFFGATF